MDYIERIEALIRSFCSLFYLGSYNHKFMVEKCIEIGCRNSMDVYGYNISQGIWRPGAEKVKNGDIDLIEMLNRILATRNEHLSSKRKLFLFEHFDVVLESRDPLLLTKLKVISEYNFHQHTVILLGRAFFKLPAIIEDIPEVTVPNLSRGDIRDLLRLCQKDLLDGEAHELAQALAGLTYSQCETVLALCMAKRKKLDVQFITDEKLSMLSQKANGFIELYQSGADLSQVGGLDALKDWLWKRARYLKMDTTKNLPSIPQPKGVLLTGPPGCGKSFLVSCLAGSWKVNLIKLTLPRLYSSLVGETEKNFLAAIETVKSLAPAILWIDEFEKFFPYVSRSNSDGGVQSRVLGVFLDFLQSRRDGVFVCATTNAIIALPQEILRAGRFDAIFFVDLPNRREREAILRVVLKKYGLEKKVKVSETLIEATESFSGAEIEQAVVEGLYECNNQDTGMSEFTLLRVIQGMIPLAVTMEEEITGMREWCYSRARFASYPDSQSNKERGRLCHISPR